MSSFRMMKKRILIAVFVSALVLALVLGPWVIPFFRPWSTINCRRQEINIKTGHARYCRYLWFVKVSESVEDTALSKALAGESVDAADIEPWHTVNIFSPACTHSPHCRFHGALAQARQLDRMFKRFVPNAQRDREVAREILRLWHFRVSHADRWTEGRWSLGEVPLPEESPESRYWRLILEHQAAAVPADPQQRYRKAVEFYQLLQEQGTDFYTLLEKSRAKLLSESEDKAFGRICALQRDVIQWGHETPDPNVVPEDQEAVRAVIAEFRREPSSQPKLKRSLGDDDRWDNIEFHFYDRRRCRVTFEHFYPESRRAISGVTLYLVKHPGKWELLFWSSWIS